MLEVIRSKLLLNEDVGSLDAIRGYLSARHKLLWDSFLWKDSAALYRDVPVPVDPLTGQYLPDMVVPESAARVIAVVDQKRENNLKVAALVSIAQHQNMEGIGGVLEFQDVSATGIPFPTTNTPLRIKFLANAADTGLDVTLAVGGDYDEASYPATGDLPTTTLTVNLASAAYVNVGRKVARMTKPVSQYPVQVSLQDEAGLWPVKNWVWMPHSTESEYARIRFHNAPNLSRDGAGMLVSILAKRKPRPFEKDEDHPALRGSEPALMAMAMGDALERERMYTKANAKFQEAAALVEVMKDAERNQSAYTARLVPEETLWAGSRQDFDW